MEFEDFLISKKIDAAAFKADSPDLFLKFKLEFNQQHPKSFTAQKLFLINGIRRKFPLVALEGENKQEVVKKPRPVIKPVVGVESGAPKKQAKPVMARSKPIINKEPKPENADEGEKKQPARPVMKRPKMN